MTVAATFRFYAELNDLLAPERRGHEFTCRCVRAATTKHMIEALGVPHTEVELVLVDGESVGFERALDDGDRVAVYPKCEMLDVTPLLRVRDRALRETRFVADAHLGGLAHLLRTTGFDTLYDNHFGDDDVERLAASQGRIVLTRDRDLLKRSAITHGCYLRALRSELQLREVFDRLDLARSAKPFTRCLSCNTPLRAIDKAQIAARLPPGVRQRYERFPRLRWLRARVLGRHALAAHAAERLLRGWTNLVAVVARLASETLVTVEIRLDQERAVPRIPQVRGSVTKRSKRRRCMWKPA